MITAEALKILKLKLTFHKPSTYTCFKSSCIKSLIDERTIFQAAESLLIFYAQGPSLLLDFCRQPLLVGIKLLLHRLISVDILLVISNSII